MHARVLPAPSPGFARSRRFMLQNGAGSVHEPGRRSFRPSPHMYRRPRYIECGCAHARRHFARAPRPSRGCSGTPYGLDPAGKRCALTVIDVAYIASAPRRWDAARAEMDPARSLPVSAANRLRVRSHASSSCALMPSCLVSRRTTASGSSRRTILTRCLTYYGNSRPRGTQ